MLNWTLTHDTIEKNELDKLSKFIKSTDKLTYGEQTELFEKNFSDWNQTKYSLMVNSGSSANLVMAIALKKFLNKDRIKIGISSLTWSTSVSPFSLLGYDIYFYDSQINNFGINKKDLIDSITNQKIDAILITHILGFPSVDEEIVRLAKNYGVIILEDCCEALGATVKNKKVGNFGIMSSYSFFYSHHMSTIEGGMFCTNNKKLFDLSKLIRSHGLSRELEPKTKDINWKKRFYFIEEGLNLRPTELNAFIGNLQLKKIDKLINERNNNFSYFISKLPNNYINNFDQVGISSFSLPLISKNRETFSKTLTILEKNKIEYRPLIAGNLLNHPLTKKFKYKKLSSNFKNSDLIDKFGIYIGNGSHVNKNKIDNLIKALHE